jgi:hypothetical protein
VGPARCPAWGIYIYGLERGENRHLARPNGAVDVPYCSPACESLVGRGWWFWGAARLDSSAASCVLLQFECRVAKKGARCPGLWARCPKQAWAGFDFKAMLVLSTRKIVIAGAGSSFLGLKPGPNSKSACTKPRHLFFLRLLPGPLYPRVVLAIAPLIRAFFSWKRLVVVADAQHIHYPRRRAGKARHGGGARRASAVGG